MLSDLSETFLAQTMSPPGAVHASFSSLKSKKFPSKAQREALERVIDLSANPRPCPILQRPRKPTKREMTVSAAGQEIIELKYDRRLLRRDLAICVFSFLGMLSAFTAVAVTWYLIRQPNRKQVESFRLKYHCDEGILDEDRTTVITLREETESFEQWGERLHCKEVPLADLVDNVKIWIGYVRLCYYTIVGTTFVTILCIVDYYRLQYHRQLKYWSRIVMYSKGVRLDPRSKPFSFTRSILLRRVVVEIVIHLLIPYPWWVEDPVFDDHKNLTHDTSEMSWNTWMDVIMILRWYVFLRLAYHLSPVYRKRFEIVRNNVDMMRKHYEVTVRDALKMYFYSYTISASLILEAACIFCGGYALFLFERDQLKQKGKLDDPVNCIYCMFVTIRTIGYGDMVAVTTAGRIVTVVFTTMGMAVEIVLGSIIINRFTMRKDECYVQEYMQTTEHWCEYKVTAVMLIQAAWKSCMRYKYLRGIITKKQHTEWMKRYKAKRAREAKKNKFSGNKLAGLLFGGRGHVRDDGSSEGGPDETPAQKSNRHHRQSMISNNSRKSINNNNNTARLRDTFRPMLQEHWFPPLDRPHTYKRLHPSQMIRENKQLFTTDVDLLRYRDRNINPRGFNWCRTFTGTYETKITIDGKVVTARVPYALAHKCSIMLEALKRFRNSRRRFKEALLQSVDNALEQKLCDVFEVLEHVEKKLQVTSAALSTLDEAVQIELGTLKHLVEKEIGARVRVPL